MMIFKLIFSSQRFLVKTRRIYASIACLLQVNSTQLALKVAARDSFTIQSTGYLIISFSLPANQLLQKSSKALCSTLINLATCNPSINEWCTSTDRGMVPVLLSN